MAALLPSTRRDLESLAALLEDSEQHPAARSRLQGGDKTVALLARAIDAHLDRDAERVTAAEAARSHLHEELSALSHDIRTPLAGAQGYLQLAECATDQAQAEHYVAAARERLDVMRRLVDGLLEYARATDPSRPTVLEEVSLVETVLTTLTASVAEFEHRGWEPAIKVGEDEPVVCDVRALERIVGNLVANALDHGAGAPTIVCSSTSLEVSNPIAADDAARLDLERLTERFYCGDPARSGGHCGLGLAAADALARSMGALLDFSLLPGPVFRTTLTLPAE